MFTGIVQQSLPLAHVEDVHAGQARRFGLDFPPELRTGLEIGASVSVNGVCLTVTDITGVRVGFDLMLATLDRTNLAAARVGDRVNIERSLRTGDEVGGHHLSGHVDTTARVVLIDQPAGNHRIAFRLDEGWIRYVFAHGFIAINGVSLTVGEVDRASGTFDVWLIPETLRRTNLGSLTPGSRVNIEIDRATQVMVDTIADATRRFLDEALSSGRLDRIDPAVVKALAGDRSVG